MTDTPISGEGGIWADIEEISARFESLSISPTPRPPSCTRENYGRFFLLSFSLELILSPSELGLQSVLLDALTQLLQPGFRCCNRYHDFFERVKSKSPKIVQIFALLFFFLSFSSSHLFLFLDWTYVKWVSALSEIEVSFIYRSPTRLNCFF